MNFKNLTWQQVVIVVACIAAILAAAKFAGPNTSAIMGSIGLIVAWFTQSPHDPNSGSGSGGTFTGTAAMAICVFVFGGCNLFTNPALKSEREALEKSACVIAAVELGTDISTAATDCGVAVELAETIVQGFESQKKTAAVKFAKAHSIKDAGIQ